MSIITKTQDLEKLKISGQRLGEALRATAKICKPGITTLALDKFFTDFVISFGDKPAFLNYQPEGHSFPFPAGLCVSINNEVVHGIPKSNVIIKEGDVVKLDAGVLHEGLFTDSAITVVAGKNKDKKVYEFLKVCQDALALGIEKAVAGNTVGDIGQAIQKHVESAGFSVIRELCGHGIGYKIHEEPYIFNYGRAGQGKKLTEGMVIAIEPIIAMGKGKIIDGNDGYTLVTKDGSIACQFEHTILIKKGKSLVITK